jgi:hypothetical protein
MIFLLKVLRLLLSLFLHRLAKGLYFSEQNTLFVLFMEISFPHVMQHLAPDTSLKTFGIKGEQVSKTVFVTFLPYIQAVKTLRFHLLLFLKT